MIYPKNYESKIGFDEVRRELRSHCLSPLGKDAADEISWSAEPDVINRQLTEVREYRKIQESGVEFPLQYLFDVRAAVARLRLQGTHLEEEELFDLRRSQDTVCRLIDFLAAESDGQHLYPTLHALTEPVVALPQLVRSIDRILDKYGKVRDDASPELLRVRRELEKTSSGISRILYGILRSAQSEGLIDKDTTPSMRDGRLVIPVVPAMKRKIRGIVHDESASGKTVFIEPAEVVEANNRVRELEGEERREVIRILVAMADELRPHVDALLASYVFLGKMDMIQAKAETARSMHAIEPTVKSEPLIDWRRAIHPLLHRSLESQGKHVVPLDIELRPESRILVISGPNAGGKSVCLKTVGLLQYMVQCGLSVPMSEHSTMGLFRHLMLDMGDEQSIEDDLSTYSSHLTNMKQMIRQSSDSTLLLIDEFGTGTEPQIGGAIAEAVLRQFHARGSWAVITTHYQNLKHFADSHEGVVNGAMLYDRHEMRPLFQLETGRPGSSFAIEIARKTGLPEEVIRDASEIVGSDYIQSDKYLQDIVRDKRYWEHKRQAIHQQEKQLADRIEHYERVVGEIEGNRKEILRRAKVQAEELLTESNKKIENTIREIREQQAEKEQTRRLREELNAYRDEVSEADNKEADAFIAKKIAQIQARKERKARRKREKEEQQTQAPTPSEASRKTGSDELHEGDTVRMRGQQTVGIIESIQGKTVTAVFGGLRTRLRADQLVLAEQPKTVAVHEVPTSRVTRDTIDEHSKDFRQEIDVRGMRGDEAIDAVMHYIDDAVLMSVGRVRILHGTGSGILRQLIRQYLGTEPNVVNYHDEHVQFGGAGITVVELR